MRLTYTDALTDAIIEQAVIDYFNIQAGFKQPTAKCNQDELENFFRSDYFSLMTRLNGDYLIRRIKEKAKMEIEYTVFSEKGSSRYYVCRVGEEKTPLSRYYTTKKKALHKAAEMQGIDYKKYMAIRRRDNVNS